MAGRTAKHFCGVLILPRRTKRCGVDSELITTHQMASSLWAMVMIMLQRGGKVVLEWKCGSVPIVWSYILTCRAARSPTSASTIDQTSIICSLLPVPSELNKDRPPISVPLFAKALSMGEDLEYVRSCEVCQKTDPWTLAFANAHEYADTALRQSEFRSYQRHCKLRNVLLCSFWWVRVIALVSFTFS